MARIPPAVVAGVAALAQVTIARRARSTPASRLAAAPVAVVSVGVIAGSVAGFRREKTTVNPLDPDQATALVTAGPYRLSRNPMYLGMAGLLLTHALARRSWSAALPAAVYVAIMDQTQIPAEEAALRGTFGSAYDDYAGRVPRWLRPLSKRGVTAAVTRARAGGGSV